MKNAAFVSILFLLALPSLVFSQTTIYANSTTGNDNTGNGSSASPFKTFVKAYTTAADGNVIDLTGTFSWSDAAETGDAVSTGYTIAKNLTIRGQAAASTIIQAAATENTADRRVFTVPAGVSLTLVDVTVRYGNLNTAVNYDGGGGIKNSGTLYMDGCLITRNRTHTGSNQFGGGILVAGSGSATIIACTIAANSCAGAQGWGGAVMYGNYGTPGPLVMKNTVVNDNTSTGRGAFSIMLTSSAGYNQISNCTFFNNTAASYGALWLDRTYSVITNCTIAGNPAGGMGFYANTVYLKNNLLADNTTFDFHYLNSNGTIADNGYNIVETSTGNSGVYSFTATGDKTGDQANLGLASTLADNGSLSGTKTLSLPGTSVAVNAGNATAHGPAGFAVTPPLYDQRSYSRNGAVDIGAYEYNGTPSYCWEGTYSSNWNTAANWRNKAVPTGTFNLILYPVVAYNNLQLDQNRTLGSIDLTAAGYDLVLNNYSLTCNTLIGGSSTSYVQTNGTGSLTATIADGASLSLPVGNSAYNPVTITNNSGATDNFTVRVLDEVYANGLSGPVISAPRIQRTWDVSKATSNGGSGVGFVFNWNTGENTATITSPALFHYEGGWVKKTGTTSSTATSLTYAGYTGTFSPFIVAEGNATLPLRWQSFTVKEQNKQVVLEWKTESERETDRFIIQRSSNGTDWATIGTKTASGTSSSVQAYTFVDVSPVDGYNFYRLLQKDVDGKETYSTSLYIKLGSQVHKLDIYPNPVINGTMNIQLEDTGLVQIFNSTGALVFQKLLQAGTQKIILPNLPKGIYHVKKGIQTIPMVIQ